MKQRGISNGKRRNMASNARFLAGSFLWSSFLESLSSCNIIKRNKTQLSFNYMTYFISN